MFSFIGSLIIGGIAGLIAGTIRKGKGFGILGNIIVGVIGSFLGGKVLGVFGFNTNDANLFGSLLVAVLSALILLGALNFLGKKDVT